MVKKSYTNSLLRNYKKNHPWVRKLPKSIRKSLVKNRPIDLGVIELHDEYNNEYKYNFETGLYYVWSGSSYGRPFTEFDIFAYDNSKDKNQIGYGLFWRIDTDSSGPYLSLRMYYKYENEIEKKKKILIYDKLREKSEELISKIKILNFNWENVKKYKNGNGGDYEATVVHFNLKGLLLKWNNKVISNEFIDKIHEYNNSIEETARNLQL